MTFPTPHIGHSRHGLFFTRWIVNQETLHQRVTERSAWNIYQPTIIARHLVGATHKSPRQSHIKGTLQHTKPRTQITKHITPHTNHRSQNNAHKLNRYRLHVTISLSLSLKRTLDKSYSFKNQSLDQKAFTWFLQTIKY
jgi:hypothetical protein